jgi:hypothetical protein
VTVLARLADVFARLTETATAPLCPDCRMPMALRSEDPIGELPVALERTYRCGACGRWLTRCSLWAIPD